MSTYESYVKDNDQKRRLTNRMNSTAERVGLGNAAFGPPARSTKNITAALTLPSIPFTKSNPAVGLYIVTAANIPMTLPKASAVAPGTGFRIWFQSTGGTIVPNGTDQIKGSNTTTTAIQWDIYTLISDGVSNWSQGTS